MSDTRDTIIYVTTSSVGCDGLQQHMGHPKVFIDLPKDQVIACPYCSQAYCHGVPEPQDRKATKRA